MKRLLRTPILIKQLRSTVSPVAIMIFLRFQNGGSLTTANGRPSLFPVIETRTEQTPPEVVGIVPRSSTRFPTSFFFHIASIHPFHSELPNCGPTTP
ncbi:hypothetical protein DAPPUDRAFT_239041 [Daphnia pulex]|uniref:Uncharacterized protein n=1 Tax=Daphnia pulex TaxID=6669 RepID=E9G863_DAPPU|nr:hypothetical protein DAPPUDRAFT_239041 [Daphnia pulex]|eukprot:EFX83924.1 hypothetical protein DAPPUDRAFT_239041 [Daphnia pulex]